jgi:hypothetical protein
VGIVAHGPWRDHCSFFKNMLGVITVLAQNGVADLLAAGEAHADAGRNQCVDVKPVLAHL